ncbi:sigma-70 family RNA polymerase sigma factor [Streptomyces spinosisporus]|uniref:Sigma-70 family RNA polymerase sigma factor n=1 Tax=Streptomyces spinosisporus TaxID=2927582 RepID=A0ABS9XDV6_9ACTN|nr:sigma-70 family RNA polymerase sigma factor [Streptomyces spinosisporus]MCI3240236.1 sigma-70 family RNA polymerase sigma factor [Streptomyces spinosisporus]
MSTQVNAVIIPRDTTAALVARAKAGDRDAFARLYADHYDEVHRFLLHRTRSKHLAEDLTQDVFVRALRRLETFRPLPGGTFAGWLMTIARNILTDHFKCSRTRLEVLADEFFDADERLDSAEVDALRELEVVEAAETVAVAMTTLNDAQRECLQLRFFEDLSIGETAERMGKNHGAVKTLTFRAVRSMQHALTEAEGAAA